jgi:hypothetical protein
MICAAPPRLDAKLLAGLLERLVHPAGRMTARAAPPGRRTLDRRRHETRRPGGEGLGMLSGRRSGS